MLFSCSTSYRAGASEPLFRQFQDEVRGGPCFALGLVRGRSEPGRRLNKSATFFAPPLTRSGAQYSPLCQIWGATTSSPATGYHLRDAMFQAGQGKSMHVVRNNGSLTVEAPLPLDGADASEEHGWFG